MSYKIKLTPQAEKFLDKLEKKEALRIINKLKEVSKDPFRYLEHYEGEGYKLRIGNYRGLIDVNLQNGILKIRLLDKRERIYKNR